jgi:predicted transcriptional regulator
MPQDEILEYLTEQWPSEPTQREIAKALGKVVSTVNEQLQMLEKKGMIGSRGKLKNKRYFAAPQAVKAFLEQLKSDRKQMQISLDEMKQKLELAAGSNKEALELLRYFVNSNNPDQMEKLTKMEAELSESLHRLDAAIGYTEAA